jgi:hypothetical protein
VVHLSGGGLNEPDTVWSWRVESPIGLLSDVFPEKLMPQAERLPIINWWEKKILLLSDIRSIQIIEGDTECIPESDIREQHSYSKVQLNLVMSNSEFHRINISNDADRRAAVESALILSRFLKVPLDDVTGLTDT